jgi:hypothetical protein
VWIFICNLKPLKLFENNRVKMEAACEAVSLFKHELILTFETVDLIYFFNRKNKFNKNLLF